MYIAVKDSIVKQLNEHFPDTDIFTEEIPDTKHKVGNYFFISILPISTETVNSHFTQISMLVDIAGYLKAERNNDYIRLSMKLDDIFRPVFNFEDRAITIRSADTRIVDSVLHYTFTLNFTVSKAIIEDNDLMDQLDSNYKL